MDAGNGAGVYGFLDQIFRSSFAFDDLGLFGFVIKIKNLGTDFLARPASDALLFNEVYSFTHVVASFGSRNIITAGKFFVNTQFLILGGVTRNPPFIPEGYSLNGLNNS